MIRRLYVQGWRAFDRLTLNLSDGLTFVVAENGVGKTSLVQAAAWGLYGPLSTVDARSAQRIDGPDTRVEVDLELPDGRLLTVERSVGRRSDSVSARVDGAELDDDGLARAMAEAFGASREFLSMTTVLPSDAVTDDTAGVFHLQAHLRRAFGVDDLQKAAETLQRLHEEAAEAARTIRRATRRGAADRSRLRGELSEAMSAEQAAQAAKMQARRVVAFAETQLRQARERENAAADAAAARQQFADLLASSRAALGRGTRLGRITRPGQLAVALDAAEAAAVDALDAHRRDAATIAGRLETIRAAADSVHAAGAECPVCRRDLTPEDIAHAERTHQADVKALRVRERRLAAQVESASQRLAALRELNRRMMRLPEIKASADGSADDVEAAEFALRAARDDADRLDDAAASARAHRAMLAARLSEEERVAREAQQAHQAHRREAVTSVAAEVMRVTADAVLAERIDPLTAEISHRWKRIFGERGSLQLRPDGRLVLARGVGEIPFTQFSSGEKVVALLATRLLVLGVSTKASFLWLDEPLEHLDPRNRRITASLMGAAGPHIRQILVTTYEEALARRLASTASAHLRYVRSADA
jgi:ABC-type transport system involved in cytochrome c biogenesis ATPase subunit